MKLAKKLKKAMGLMLISTMVLSAAPVMAADYDNHWAKEAITKWNDYDVVQGYEDGTFKPNNQVKRSELAAFIVRVFGLESTEGATQFADVANSAWYAKDVAKVSAAGIMQGASGKFNPNGFATREEVAVTLVNAFQLTGTSKLSFNDADEIAAWAKEAVQALASNGYAKGQGNNNFAPKANITRAEVVQLLDNIVEKLVNKAGTYTNNIAGNVVINTTDAVLDGIKVNGNVYLAQGIGLGDATLSNTEVAGKVLVAGGGVNSIHFDKVAVTGGVTVNTKAPVRLVSKDSALSVAVEANQSLVLTGSFKEVVVPSDVVLELKGATVEKITVEAVGNATASITVDKASVVKEVVAQAAAAIKGEGKIELLKVEVEGVKTEIKPDKIETAPNVTDQETSEDKDDNKNDNNNSDNSDDDDSDDDDDKDDVVITPPVVIPPTTDDDEDDIIITPPVVTPPTEEDKPVEEKPVYDYIAIGSVALNGETVPSSALQINGKEITLNINGLTSLSQPLETVKVGFENLEAGEQIKALVSVSMVGEKELKDTVEADGTVTFNVSALTEQFAAKKDAIMNQLQQLPYYKTVERVLANAGISLNDIYAEDGSVDTIKAVETMQKLLKYVKANPNDADIVDLVETIEFLLKKQGVKIDVNSASVTGTITLTTQKFVTTYQVTIMG